MLHEVVELTDVADLAPSYETVAWPGVISSLDLGPLQAISIFERA